MRSIIALLPLLLLPLAAQTDGAAPAASRSQLSEETAGPLKALEVMPMPGAVKGRFDHFGVDLKHNRLFATHEDYRSVLVLDLGGGRKSVGCGERVGLRRPR